MKEQKQPAPTHKIVSLSIGVAASVISLAGGAYQFSNMFNWYIAGLFVSLEETGRIYYMSQWRSNGKTTNKVIYFLLAAGILFVNIAAFDSWVEQRKQETLKGINTRINTAIIARFDSKRDSIEIRYKPLIEAAWANYSQNRGIAARKNDESWRRFADERKNEYQELIQDKKKEIRLLLENRAKLLSENRTSKRIFTLTAEYKINYDLSSSIERFRIYRLANSTGIIIVSLFMAIMLEILIFNSFYAGFGNQKSDKPDKKSDTKNQNLINPENNLIDEIRKNQELINLIAGLMAKYKENANKSAFSGARRELFVILRNKAQELEVKDADRK